MCAKRRVPRVLVVDDEESIRTFAEQALRDAGYHVVVAVDGPDALRVAAEAGAIDLLLADLMLPGMRGDELAKLMRQTLPELQVVYLTGYRNQLFSLRPALWDNEAVLEKPATIKSLLDIVASRLVTPPRRSRT